MIGRSGERWSGISVLAVRHDDDDTPLFTSILSIYLFLYFSLDTFDSDVPKV